MNQSQQDSIQNVITDAIRYHRVDGCFLRDQHITDEAYLLVEDLTERLPVLSPPTITTELEAMSSEGQYFIRHYSKYDQFIALSDIQHALNQTIH